MQPKKNFPFYIKMGAHSINSQSFQMEFFPLIVSDLSQLTTFEKPFLYV